MENENMADPYEAVIADLRAQKDKIDQAISLLESLRGAGVSMSSGMASAAAAAAGKHDNNPVPALGPGAFLSMSIPDAARKLLSSQRRQMTTAEITREIERGGVVLTSSDKVNTVGSVLLRRFYQNGDIVRVSRGIWGLAAWYPGRKFQKSGAGKGEENGSKGNHEESEVVGNEEETKPVTPDSTINVDALIGGSAPS
jgi:hypothetical protein